MNNKILAIDGDIIAYRAAAACEVEIKWEEGFSSLFSYEVDVESHIDKAISKLLEEGGMVNCIAAVSHPDNFRKKVAPYYKANRTGKRKPFLLMHALDYIMDKYDGIKWPNLEADDVLGILGSAPSSDYVIWSIDKDLLTIAGQHLIDGKHSVITEEQADYWFLYQALVGDITDNYQGCPKIGPKSAEKLFEKYGATWDTVVAAYMNAQLSEEVALENARLARILRHGEYNLTTGEVTLWNP